MVHVTEVVTTYGDLEAGERIVDKSRNIWHLFGIEPADGAKVALSIGSLDVTFPTHFIERPGDESVTVLRAPSHEQKVAEAEAEVDEAQGGAPEEQPTTAEAVETLEAEMGAEVVAEQSAEESDALAAGAAKGEPHELPDFADFTDLEMRSHLYLVHGIYAQDVKFRDALRAMHDEAHADPEHRFVPHVHSSDTPFPTTDEER